MHNTKVINLYLSLHVTRFFNIWTFLSSMTCVYRSEFLWSKEDNRSASSSGHRVDHGRGAGYYSITWKSHGCQGLLNPLAPVFQAYLTYNPLSLYQASHADLQSSEVLGIAQTVASIPELHTVAGKRHYIIAFGDQTNGFSSTQAVLLQPATDDATSGAVSSDPGVSPTLCCLAVTIHVFGVISLTHTCNML